METKKEEPKQQSPTIPQQNGQQKHFANKTAWWTHTR